MFNIKGHTQCLQKISMSYSCPDIHDTLTVTEHRLYQIQCGYQQK